MSYHESLKKKIHYYIMLIYKVTNDFPKKEMYGVTSQLRRSAVSVMLNYVEGFARRRSVDCKVYDNFIKISYGSLKESEYLIYLSYCLKYLTKEDYEVLRQMADEIGGMIYKIRTNSDT